MSWAAWCLALRSEASVYLRNSPAASGSSLYPSGSSRASTGSSGVVGSSPAGTPENSSSSSSTPVPLSSAATRVITWPTRLRNSDASAAASQARTPPPRVDRNGSTLLAWPLLVLAHGRPQAVAVQHLDVVLHRLPGPGGDHRLALVVHVEHQLGGLLLRVPEDVLEHVGHVRHQIHRVVPHDGDPGPIRHGFICGPRKIHLSGRHAHNYPPPST